MLTSGQMKSLKQKNVSSDAEKTKTRIKEDFSAASSADKTAIVDLSGQNRNSFYRVYDTGSANARIILAMAQILNVSPFYYSGAVDERTVLTDVLIIQFLRESGHVDLASEIEGAEIKTKRTYKKKAKVNSMIEDNNINDAVSHTNAPIEFHEQSDDNTANEISEVAPEENIEETLVYTLEFLDSEKMRTVVNELTLSDAIMLLEALYFRARAGSDAEKYVEIVKRCLLS